MTRTGAEEEEEWAARHQASSRLSLKEFLLGVCKTWGNVPGKDFILEMIVCIGLRLWFMRYMTGMAICAAAQDPGFRRAPLLVQCQAISLEILNNFRTNSLCLHFILGPAS